MSLMFRVGPSVLKYKTIPLLFHRGSPVEIRTASISRSAVHLKLKFLKTKDAVRERTPCPQPPPPSPPPPKNDALFWSLVALSLMTGVFTAYAKNDPELRDWLWIQAPWLDDLIAAVWQENCSYTEFFIHSLHVAQEKLDELMAPLPPECNIDQPAIEAKPVSNEVSQPEAPEQGDTVPCDEDDDEDDDDGDDDDDDQCGPPDFSNDPLVLQDGLRELAQAAIDNYSTVEDACNYYNKLVIETVEMCNYNGYKELKEAEQERKDLVRKHTCLAGKIVKAYKELHSHTQCVLPDTTDQEKRTKQLAKDYSTMIEIARLRANEMKEKSLVVDNYWHRVKAKLDVVVDQIKSVYPAVDYEERHPTTGTGDIDLLLAHFHRLIEDTKKQVLQEQKESISKLNAIASHIPFKTEKERQLKYMQADKAAREKMDKHFIDKLNRYKQQYEDELQQGKAKQQAEHEQALAETLKQMDEEASETIKRLVKEKVEPEKKKFSEQLGAMRERLGQVEATLNARLKADRERKRALKLYAASSALIEATKKGDRYVDVSKELAILEQNDGAEDGDKLVKTVLNTIPPEVREKGVVPESVLKKNYKKMEGVALKVALVGSEGAPLPLYWFSWLHYMLLMKPLLQPHAIPHKEKIAPPKEPFKNMDNFDLLQRANYYIDKGDLANALRYVSALRDASSYAASHWRREASAHMRTRQAAEAVRAHALAITLQNI